MSRDPITPNQVDAFVDGELELSARLAMETRSRDDAALRARIDDARQLRDTVREGADYHAAPEDFRDRMAAMLAPPRRPGVRSTAPSPARSPAAPIADALRRWFGWRPLATSIGLAAVLTVALNVAGQRDARERQLADDVVASHVRSTLGQHLLDVASSDHHTVKPFLSARLGFSPPVHELDLPGSSFLGGRVDYLDGRPVAALVYRQGQHIVNAFVWPSKEADSAPVFASDRGFRTARWTRDGMAHWLISDVNAEEFQALASAARRADQAR